MLLIAFGSSHVPEVRAVVFDRLEGLQEKLEDSRDVFDRYLANMIEVAQDAGEFTRRDTVAKIPPGSPI